MLGCQLSVVVDSCGFDGFVWALLLVCSIVGLHSISALPKFCSARCIQHRCLVCWCPGGRSLMYLSLGESSA